MNDTLAGFDWPSLHSLYDSGCGSFDSRSQHLSRFQANRPATDRDLYHQLVEHYSSATRLSELDPVGLYESLLYWKLYSLPTARSRIAVWLATGSDARRTAAETLPRLLSMLPTSLGRDVDTVIDLVKQLGTFKLPGMASSSAIPVRSTFLHFLFPSTVPIFDKMVLQAVGVDHHGANQDYEVFREYLPFVWGLADKHEATARQAHTESPLRLMDMALWIIRGTLIGA